ncbi:hypothetical protein BDV25DRAFT_148719 [Aspergillus avenaceus]|uniref:Uncharacterized protein n=1 Tax=Aspergillus avenaceus TaxID=36643 RepID=A0A5N6U526_ASPAV|nr:hypothetical protein BDV25DRAFT_148719 [Aspergillus avenaceus]
MPHLLNHRRRHSWPYCGPAPRRNSPVMRIPDQQVQLEQQYLTPLAPGDFLGDDATSAGIVRSKTTRSHRIWPYSKPAVATSANVPHINASSSYGHGTGSFRRMIRPPLDKARSLFVLPTTTTAGENVLVSYWVQGPPVQPVVPDRGRVSTLLSDDRNHRRCHSEQPRSWRRPSASLWTLKEE